MNNIHDALHNMPWWIIAVLVGILIAASLADEDPDNSYRQRRKPVVSRAIDNLGSWLAFAAIITGTLAYFWPS